MGDSDDEDILYDNDLGRNLIGGKRVKNVDDVLNGGKKDKRKLRKTFALCMAFLCLGLCIAILGPTLLSLQEHLHTTLPKISWVFAGRSMGYLSGAVLGGMLFESFNSLFLLAVCLLLCGIGIVIAPYVTTVLFLGVCISSVGVSMGVLDTGANLLCLRMWGKKRSGTMLQALHFSFAVGAFIAPLVAAPFLVETNNAMLASGNTSSTPLQSSTLGTPATTTAEAPTTTAEQPPERDPMMTTGDLTTAEAPPEREPTTTAGDPGDLTTAETTSERKPATTAGDLTTAEATGERDTTTAANPPGTVTETTKTPVDGTTKQKRRRRDDSSATPAHLQSLPPINQTKNPTTTKDSKVPGRPSTKTMVSITTLPDPVTPSMSEPSPPQRQVERFATAYIIIGVLVLLNSGVFFYFLCTKPKHEPQYIGSDQANNTSDKNNFPFRTRILILLFFFYFLYVGGEVAYGSFVPMFATKSKHHFEQDRASHVAAVFWGIFSLGRGLAICLASVISPLKMVIMDMVGCVATSLALTLFADSNENVLWIGSALLGLSMASLFPSGIAWLESYTPVTGNTASFLIVGSALGEMCVPIIIGYLFQDIILGPMVLMYWMLATSGLSFFIFIYVIWLVKENGQEKESLPAEKSPALELFQSVEEALPMEELFKNGDSNGKQMGKPRIPPILKRKDHKE